MNEKSKSLLYSILGIGGFIGLVLVGIAFIYGNAVVEKFLPWVYIAFFLAFGFAYFVSLPLSFFRRTRAFSAKSFFYLSYIFGINLWCFSLLFTIYLWGKLEAFIGLCIAVVGIFPVALLATAFKGEWQDFLTLIFLLVLTFGCRSFALYLGHKVEQADLQQSLEQGRRTSPTSEPPQRDS